MMVIWPINHTTQVNAVIINVTGIRTKKKKTADKQFEYLPLINRAGGLYGRILTEFVKYRPNAVRSVLTTEVKIPPYRPTKLG